MPSTFWGRDPLFDLIARSQFLTHMVIPRLAYLYEYTYRGVSPPPNSSVQLIFLLREGGVSVIPIVMKISRKGREGQGTR
jgi:hypothetical protein